MKAVFVARNELGRITSTASTTERFWYFVRKHESCWEWIGAVGRNGYGRFWDGKRLALVHRFAFELHFGEIPPSKFICHHCDNRRCVRPDHLFVGTAKDNREDMLRKGRWRKSRPVGLRGEKNGSAKLRDYQLPEIRARLASGATQTAVALEYGVSQHTIWRIAHSSPLSPTPVSRAT
jgi:hypothetical protein